MSRAIFYGPKDVWAIEVRLLLVLSGFIIGVQLMILVCSSIPVVFSDTLGISRCLNMLFLFSPHLCFIFGFICDLYAARNDSWMSWRPTNIYFYHNGSWRRGLGSRKASVSTSEMYYWPSKGGTLIEVRFVKCSLVFHQQMLFFWLFFFVFFFNNYVN